MNLERLINNKNWETALIIFDSSNWANRNFTEQERTYRVSSDAKYFDYEKCGSSLFGNCLDGKDLGVRLDLYKWKVEDIIIEN